MSVENFITINIDLRAQPSEEASFGVFMAMGAHRVFPELFREYSGDDVLGDMITDGFNEDTHIFQIARPFFTSSGIRPDKLIVGNRANTGVAFIVDTVVEGSAYTLRIDDKTYTHVAVALDTATIIATAIKALYDLDAITNITVVDDLGGQLTVTSTDVSTEDFTASTNLGWVAVYTTTQTYVEAITALSDTNDNFSVFMIDTTAKADILAVAAYAESLDKVFGYITDDAEENVIGSILSTSFALKAFGYERTFGHYTNAFKNNITAALIGARITKTPGSTTWAHVDLKAVTAPEVTKTQRSQHLTNNLNVLQNISPYTTSRFGTMAGGIFIDLIRGKDFLDFNLSAAILRLFVESDKVPYSDTGASMIENECRAQIASAQDDGYVALDPVPTFDFPDIPQDTPLVDRTNRDYRIAKISFRLEGAIHKTTINITATP